MVGSRRIHRWLLALTIASFAGCSKEPVRQPGGRLAVAAAADLKFALDEIAVEFRRAQPSIDVAITYGSSGSFYSQLSQRAPFDLFLSADMQYPARLIESGLADGDTRFVYAIGRIVLWVPTNSMVDVSALGMKALTQASVRKVAIANPAHAPYGRAAVAAMEKLGVYGAVKEQLVFGENVAQAAQFVESGAADAGIIALSLALAPPMASKGRYWEIPTTAYPRMDQGGVILKWAAHPEAAREFRAFLMGPDRKTILRRQGFSLPEE